MKFSFAVPTVVKILVMFVSSGLILACGGGSTSKDVEPPVEVPSGNNESDDVTEQQPLSISLNPAAERYQVSDALNFSSTVTGGVQPYQYQWDFGDGEKSSQALGTHQYQQPGRYEVILQVTDASGDMLTETVVVDIHYGGNIQMKLLGFNDFHGQLSAIEESGGSVNLAAHLLVAAEQARDGAFLLHGGDHVGGSPANSALMQDEPAIEFLNLLAEALCEKAPPLKRCDVLGTAGNHEFDEGGAEMLRLVNGGNHVQGPYLSDPWLGANFSTLSANVRYKESQTLLLPAYEIREVAGVDVAFVGITLDSTPNIVLPGVVSDLEFIDQSFAAEQVVLELQSKGIESIVFLVHDGVSTAFYDGPTQTNTVNLNSTFGRFVQALPAAVDVVIAGHTHGFTNAVVNTLEGSSVLVTQAYSKGRAYSDIDIEIDPSSGDIVKKTARIINTANSNQLEKSNSVKTAIAKVIQLENQANDFAEKITERVINEYQSQADELSLGEFIADAHRYGMDADLGVTNSGGIRGVLRDGPVTWGQLFAIQPFENDLVKRVYKGTQLIDLIARGDIWSSNLSLYQGSYFIARERIIDQAQYTLAGNAFIMNSVPYSVGEELLVGTKDIEALVAYIEAMNTPFSLNSKP